MVIGLIVADIRYNSLDRLRALVDGAASPIFLVTDLPARLFEWAGHEMRLRTSLLEENARLRRENLVLEGRSLEMASLEAENSRLRTLLNSTALLRNDVLVAELIGVSPDPVRHQLVLNKGDLDGVFIGQPMIDADGLMGQVIEVSSRSSRAMLITDSTHSVPVQINRNGVRAIVEGSGSLNSLEVRHVSETTDIRVGDLLETSGLGGRFPVGYPVAVVNSIEQEPGEPFTRVRAVPTAALDRSRHVLLVFTAAAMSALITVTPPSTPTWKPALLRNLSSASGVMNIRTWL